MNDEDSDRQSITVGPIEEMKPVPTGRLAGFNAHYEFSMVEVGFELRGLL